MSIQAPNSTIAAGGCYCPPTTDPSNPTNASTTMVGGKAVFENDNYRITMGDDNTVTIRNKHTGETYQAWGDPHMKIDGKQAFDFWGTTSFKLEDGTNVTIETTPWGNNPNATLSSKVTITNGDYGVQVSGVDTNRIGDLKIDEAKGWGKLLDAVVDDGNVLHENPAGQGFVAIDANGVVRKVDQNYINETDLLKGGAAQLQDQFKDAFRVLGGLVSIVFVGVFLSALAKALERAIDRPAAPKPNDPIFTIMPVKPPVLLDSGRIPPMPNERFAGTPDMIRFRHEPSPLPIPRFDEALRASHTFSLTLARQQA
ncbi:hypothetical protein RHDC3_01376 [Rhodocyclaceae bacterium]|nr:hypothetical protein RHDC3_01376 [Rhodocyclaceae bacterium]